MKRLKRQFWGWGIYVDEKGELLDVFPQWDDENPENGEQGL